MSSVSWSIRSVIASLSFAFFLIGNSWASDELQQYEWGPVRYYELKAEVQFEGRPISISTVFECRDRVSGEGTPYDRTPWVMAHRLPQGGALLVDPPDLCKKTYWRRKDDENLSVASTDESLKLELERAMGIKPLVRFLRPVVVYWIDDASDPTAAEGYFPSEYFEAAAPRAKLMSFDVSVLLRGASTNSSEIVPWLKTDDYLHSYFARVATPEIWRQDQSIAKQLRQIEEFSSLTFSDRSASSFAKFDFGSTPNVPMERVDGLLQLTTTDRALWGRRDYRNVDGLVDPPYKHDLLLNGALITQESWTQGALNFDPNTQYLFEIDFEYLDPRRFMPRKRPK